MSKPIVFSKRVVETIKSLPIGERKAVSDALTAELLLGEDPSANLTPFQAVIYSAIRYYVKRDSEREEAGLPLDGFSRERLVAF